MMNKFKISLNSAYNKQTNKTKKKSIISAIKRNFSTIKKKFIENSLSSLKWKTNEKTKTKTKS